MRRATCPSSLVLCLTVSFICDFLSSLLQRQWNPESGKGKVHPRSTGAHQLQSKDQSLVGGMFCWSGGFWRTSVEEAPLALCAQRPLLVGSGLGGSSGEVAVKVGGTEGGNNPTPLPSFRGAGAEAVAMVTTAPWSGDFLFPSPPFALLQASAMAVTARSCFSPS